MLMNTNTCCNNCIYYFYNLYKLSKNIYIFLLVNILKERTTVMNISKSGTIEYHPIDRINTLLNRTNMKNLFYLRYIVNLNNQRKTFYKRIKPQDMYENSEIISDYGTISNHKIISINVELSNNKLYDVDISSYSLVNNIILDKDFIYYYLNYYHKLSLYNLDKSYRIVLVDKNVNFHSLEMNNYVILTKDNFIIKSI